MENNYKILRKKELIKNSFLKNLKKYLVYLPQSLFSVIFFNYPAKKLIVIGVTGTDGKTTTATLLYEIILKSGKSVALMSSTAFRINGQEINVDERPTIWFGMKKQGMIKKLIKLRVEFLIIEATSVRIDQFRHLGCDFNLVVVTNITHDHLDYHGSFENYVRVKSKIFKNAKYIILNKDDQSYELLKHYLKKGKHIIVTYGIFSNSDFTITNFQFKTNLLGEYNKYNCLAAISAASILKIPDNIIKDAIISFKGVEGRLEKICKDQNYEIYIDFAHTPNALENVLGTLKKKIKPTSSLVVIFGCSGLRDTLKRPMMGKIAAKYADKIILTADDPRTEDVNLIISQISAGCLTSGFKKINIENYLGDLKNIFFCINDRRDAIRFAIYKLMKKGDILIICGKGHEKVMYYGKKAYPWSDRETVLDLI